MLTLRSVIRYRNRMIKNGGLLFLIYSCFFFGWPDTVQQHFVVSSSLERCLEKVVVVEKEEAVKSCHFHKVQNDNAGFWTASVTALKHTCRMRLV